MLRMCNTVELEELAAFLGLMPQTTLNSLDRADIDVSTPPVRTQR